MGFIDMTTYIFTCTQEGHAIWRVIAGLFAMFFLVIAMTMATPDANPIEGMQSGVMEIVLTTLGTVTGFVTAGTRFFLKEIDCPDCDGTGNALINRTAFDAASEKCKHSCRNTVRFFKNAWRSITGGTQTEPLLRPEYC